MGYSGQNTNRGVGVGEDMEFPGVSNKSLAEFPGLIKNKMEFPGVTRKNNVQYRGVLLFGLGISKGYNTILWNFQGWSFVLSGIFRGRVKKKKKNPRLFFKKVCPRHPLFVFFSGIAQ